MGRALDLINAVLGRADARVVRASDYRRLVRFREAHGHILEPRHTGRGLPPGAAETLRPDNPRLVDLRRRYAGHPAAAASQWTEAFLADNVDLAHFRGDNAYVWQVRAFMTEAQYVASALYAARHDRLGLMDRFEEDGAFGAWCFDLDGKAISRDLLDSVLEIDFLDRHVGLSQRPAPTVLDIGAGYGRLGHRLVSVFPEMGGVLCADAVPESTFLCEYYLAFRGAAPAARAVPLDEIEGELARTPVAVATNIHSFSECPVEAIGWWLDLLAGAEVPRLMIVPNTGDRLLSTERDGSRRDFAPLVEAAGYVRTVCEPKFARSTTLQRMGLNPSRYLLFERRQPGR